MTEKKGKRSGFFSLHFSPRVTSLAPSLGACNKSPTFSVGESCSHFSSSDIDVLSQPHSHRKQTRAVPYGVRQECTAVLMQPSGSLSPFQAP